MATLLLSIILPVTAISSRVNPVLFKRAHTAPPALLRSATAAAALTAPTLLGLSEQPFPFVPTPECPSLEAAAELAAQPDHCEFYLKCIEPTYQCGASGYPVNYGFKYCTSFSNYQKEGKFSKDKTDLQNTWVHDTLICLKQNMLKAIDGTDPATSCADLKKKEFAAHPQ